jgi:ribosomal protein S18 acetylase RimI-like enzyme
VQVKCFGCNAVLEAATVEAASDAFFTHAKSDHTWPYPEHALRIYAANYAEAGERISPDTERLPDIGSISVLPAMDRVDDWLSFFDRDAFAGNPGWASCYCLEPNVPATSEDPERPWRTARATTADRLRSGATYGYLAYSGGMAVGWVNASKRGDYGLFQDVDPNGPGAQAVIGISCYVIAPPFRRHGVASALLDRVIADAPSRAAAWIEAYPHNNPEAGGAGHFRGTRAMYEARGFQRVEEKKNYTVMRRPAR